MTFFPNAPAPSDNISVSQGQLQSNNQFLANTAGNLSLNGYYKLPNGLIMQWGSTSSTSAGTVIIGYNQAYVSAPYSIQVTRGRPTGNFPSDLKFDYWLDTGVITNTTFTIINNDGHTWTYFWTAIGV